MDILLRSLFPIGILLLLLFLAFLPAILYKRKANRLGVVISWWTVLRLTARRRPPHDVLEAAGLAVKLNLEISFFDLEGLKLSGGDPMKVVTEIEEFKRKGLVLSFQHACAFELVGDSVKQEWIKDFGKGKF